jgi:hypothetical protein
MRTLSFLFAFLFAATSLMAQETTNLVKTIDPNGANAVLFDFDHKSIHLKNWEDEKKATIRIRLEIHANMPQAIMSQLVKANRYQIVAGMDDAGNYVITMPNLDKKVSVGGTDLEDEIVVRVDAPVDFFLDGKTLNRGAMLVSRDGGKPKLDTKRKMKIKKTQLEKVQQEIEIVFVQVSPAVSGTVKERIGAKKTKKEARKHSMLDASAPMSMQELKAQYGEILIDGVIFEIE